MTLGQPPPAARILLVEDSPTQAAIVYELLQRQGYVATWKATLAEGREAVAAGGLDLLLLDRYLPDGDGAQLCRECKADPRTRHLPVILLTSSGEVAERVAGLLGGADDYIPKPYHPEELLARVHGCLRTLALQRELAQRAEQLERVNRELRETQARLITAERLAAIGQIGLAIRHEINNPLGTIVVYADLLLGQAEGLPAEVRKRLEAVSRAALRIRDVIKRLGELKDDRTVEYLPGMRMTDLRSPRTEPSGPERVEG
jgi:DNA-binding response OmpR family regulator